MGASSPSISLGTSVFCPWTGLGPRPPPIRALSVCPLTTHSRARKVLVLGPLTGKRDSSTRREGAEPGLGGGLGGAGSCTGSAVGGGPCSRDGRTEEGVAGGAGRWALSQSCGEAGLRVRRARGTPRTSPLCLEGRTCTEGSPGSQESPRALSSHRPRLATPCHRHWASPGLLSPGHVASWAPLSLGVPCRGAGQCHRWSAAQRRNTCAHGPGAEPAVLPTTGPAAVTGTVATAAPAPGGPSLEGAGRELHAGKGLQLGPHPGPMAHPGALGSASWAEGRRGALEGPRPCVVPPRSPHCCLCPLPAGPGSGLGARPARALGQETVPFDR